jgi:hypothetical protein
LAASHTATITLQVGSRALLSAHVDAGGDSIELLTAREPAGFHRRSKRKKKSVVQPA